MDTGPYVLVLQLMQGRQACPRIPTRSDRPSRRSPSAAPATSPCRPHQGPVRSAPTKSPRPTADSPLRRSTCRRHRTGHTSRWIEQVRRSRLDHAIGAPGENLPGGLGALSPGPWRNWPENGSGPVTVADATVSLTRTSGDPLPSARHGARSTHGHGGRVGTCGRPQRPEPAVCARLGHPPRSRLSKAEAGPERVRSDRRATPLGPPVCRGVQGRPGAGRGVTVRRPGLHGRPPRTRAASRTAR